MVTIGFCAITAYCKPHVFLRLEICADQNQIICIIDTDVALALFFEHICKQINHDKGSRGVCQYRVVDDCHLNNV